MQRPHLQRKSNIMRLFYFHVILYECCAEIVDREKASFCETLDCVGEEKAVCGIRAEGEGFRLKIFKSECELLEFGCQVDENYAYGQINLQYCEKAFLSFVKNETVFSGKILEVSRIITDREIDPCVTECPEGDLSKVCGIRQHGPGFKIRSFANNCELLKHNCANNFSYEVTDLYICDGTSKTRDVEVHQKATNKNSTDGNKVAPHEDAFITEVETTPGDGVNISAGGKSDSNLIVIDGSMLNFDGDINDTMDNFFETTHVFDLPIRDVRREGVLDETSRRMLLKIAGPVKVFQPWIVKPENVSTDYYHEPTLSSCYHRCPKQCPDTYAPVCGVPGIVAREPSLMFKNHCFMDVAQCKMRWEDKSSTAISSSYIESSFMICLGDALNGLYRFLPLVRTLQHMGRLKKRGHFRYKMRNMGFFNNFMAREPRLMGK